jgi:two-component system, LuxR family, sensor kinase FixL
MTAVLKGHEDRLRQHGVRLHNTLRPGLPPFTCDRTQLEMVVHNLLTNALDAVVAGSRTRREIHIGASRADSEVLLAIEDSGHGVSPDITAQLFNPFVTTKADGMGLGLAISRSLLRSQSGDLWVEHSALGGARFVLRLPMAAAEPSPA